MGKVLKRILAFVKSVTSARKDLKQARQQLEQTKRRLKRVKQEVRSLAREYLLCKMPERSVCGEIGVYEGEFSQRILNVVKPERLHLIDPWIKGEGLFGDQAVSEQAIVDARYARVKEQFAEEIAADQVRIHRNLSDEISDEFEDSYFDWIYIDGNHLYEYVKQDLELYYPKVKDGGYLTGDDYGIEGWWENGIQKAVDEFVSQSPELVLEIRGTQFIIQKGYTA